MDRGKIAKDGRWPSDALKRMFPLIMSGLKMFEKILSMSVSFPLAFSLVRRVIVGKKLFEDSMFMNSDDGRCEETLIKFTLKSPARQMFLFFSREILSIRGLR